MTTSGRGGDEGAAPHVVVMGVSGSGKSTLASALARRTGGPLVEADDLHSAAAVAAMSRGEALDEAARAPWLRAVLAAMVDAERDPAAPGAVVACSALRRAHRDVLRGAGRPVVFVFLTGDAGRIRARLAARVGHFAGPALLDSQLAVLEPPGEDENAVVVGLQVSCCGVEGGGWTGERKSGVN